MNFKPPNQLGPSSHAAALTNRPHRRNHLFSKFSSFPLQPPCWTIRVPHEPSSTLADVGLQLWAGSLLLSEWLLSRRRMVAGKGILELGSGTGGRKVWNCETQEELKLRRESKNSFKLKNILSVVTLNMRSGRIQDLEH